MPADFNITSASKRAVRVFTTPFTDSSELQTAVNNLCAETSIANVPILEVKSSEFKGTLNFIKNEKALNSISFKGDTGEHFNAINTAVASVKDNLQTELSADSIETNSSMPKFILACTGSGNGWSDKFTITITADKAIIAGFTHDEIMAGLETYFDSIPEFE